MNITTETKRKVRVYLGRQPYDEVVEFIDLEHDAWGLQFVQELAGYLSGKPWRDVNELIRLLLAEANSPAREGKQEDK